MRQLLLSYSWLLLAVFGPCLVATSSSCPRVSLKVVVKERKVEIGHNIKVYVTLDAKEKTDLEPSLIRVSRPAGATPNKVWLGKNDDGRYKRIPFHVNSTDGSVEVHLPLSKGLPRSTKDYKLRFGFRVGQCPPAVLTFVAQGYYDKHSHRHKYQHHHHHHHHHQIYYHDDDYHGQPRLECSTEERRVTVKVNRKTCHHCDEFECNTELRPCSKSKECCAGLKCEYGYCRTKDFCATTTCDSGPVCKVGTCSGGVCSYDVNAANGTSCTQDGKTGECQGGVCDLCATTTCDSGPVCKVGTCSGGVCSYDVNAANGTSCTQDGKTGQCQGGVCGCLNLNNVITNPGFDTCDFSGWTKGSGGQGDPNAILIDTLNPQAGSCDASYSALINGNINTVQSLTLEVGRTYNLTIWVRSNNAPASNVRFYTELASAANGVIYTEYDDTTNNLWKQYSTTFVASAQGYTLNVVSDNRGSTPSAFYADSLSLTCVA